MARGKDYDLSFLLDDLKEDIAEALSEAYDKGGEKGVEEGAKRIKEKVKKTKVNVSENIEFDGNGSLTSEQKKQIEKAAEQSGNQVMNIVQKTMQEVTSKHKKKWKGFDLLGELGKVDLNTDSLEKELKKLYNKENFGSPKDNKKLVTLYSAHQALGGKKITEYDEELKYLTTDVTGTGGAAINNDIDFFKTIYNTVQEIIPKLKEANVEISELKANMKNTSPTVKDNKTEGVSGDISTAVEAQQKLTSEINKNTEANNRNNLSLEEKLTYLKEIQKASKFMETAEDRKTSMEEKAYDVGGNNPKSKADSLKKIKMYNDLCESIDKANYALDDFQQEYESVLVTMKDGSIVEVKDLFDLDELKLLKSQIADIKLVPFEEIDLGWDKLDDEIIDVEKVSDSSTESMIEDQNKLQKEILETEKYIEREKESLKSLGNLIEGNVSFKGKKEATESLKHLYKELTKQENETGRYNDKTVVAYNNVYNAAKELGVAQSTLDKNFNPVAINSYNKSLEHVKGSYDVTLQSIDLFTNKVQELNSQLTNSKIVPEVNQTPLSSENNKDVRNNDEVINSIRKKKEELASYELQVEELRHEIEKLLEVENGDKTGFAKVLSGKQLESRFDSITNRIFGKYDPKSGKDGSNKWLALGSLSNLEGSDNLKSYKMWEEELQKVGYRLSEIRETSVGLEADILPIDGKAVTNAEEFRRLLSEITTTPNDNIVILNSQLTELENKISTIKSEIKPLESADVTPIKDTVDAGVITGSTEKNTSGIKAETSAIEENTQAAKENKNAKKQQNNESVDNTYAENVKRTSDAYDELTKQLKDYYRIKEKEVKEGKLTGDDNKKLKDYEERIKRAILGQKEFANATDEAAISQANFNSELKRISSNLVTNFASDSNKKLNDLSGSEGKLPSYKEEIEKIRKEIEKLNAYESIDILDDAQVNNLKEAEKNITNMIKRLSSKEFNRVNDIDLNNLSSKVSRELTKNSAAPAQLREQLRALKIEIDNARKNLDTFNEVEFNELKRKFADIRAQIEATGKTGLSMSDKIKKKFKDLAAYFATYVSIQDAIQVTRQGFETINEYDKALTEMNKVSDEHIETLKEYQSESFKTADAVGATAQQIQNSTADWMRLGESLEEAKQSAQDANILFNVSEFGSIDEATESLVSMSQAYKELEKGEIIDVVNNLGNNFAISTDGLATALQNSASALKTAQNDFYEAAALTTAANTVVQDPAKVGAGLRTIALRLTGTEAAREELAALGEDVDDFVVTTTSKLDQQIKDLTKTQGNFGVSLLDMNGNYRSTYEVLLDIAKVWDKIAEEDLVTGENRQNALLEMMAGKQICLKFMETYIYRTHLIARIA